MSDFFQMTYREILQSYIDANSLSKGYRSAMAKAAGFHLSVLSQVLSGGVQLTPEQSLGLSKFWKLDERQTDYFVMRVSYERASTDELKAFIKAKLDKITILPNFTKVEVEVKPLDLTSTQAASLYAGWEPLAILAAVQVSGVQKVERIANFLKLHPEVVKKTLDNLEAMQLVKNEEGLWSVTNDNNTVIQGRSVFNRLLMTVLDTKAQSLTGQHSEVWAGSVFPTTPEQYQEIKEKIIETFKATANDYTPDQVSVVAGISLHLFQF